jgi:hypothetical protein
MFDSSHHKKGIWTRFSRKLGIWLGFITWSGEALDQDHGNEPKYTKKEQEAMRRQRLFGAKETKDSDALVNEQKAKGALEEASASLEVENEIDSDDLEDAATTATEPSEAPPKEKKKKDKPFAEEEKEDVFFVDKE